MTETAHYQDTDNQILPRTEADAIAEANVDAIEQERFDAFAPQHNIEYEKPATRIAKQTGVRVMHFVEQGTGGRGAHSGSSRERREQERTKVGLPPKGFFD